MTAAETIGQVFLGVRLQCARCHNHPFDVWTQDDYYGLAAYFGNVAPQGGQQRPPRQPRHARDQRRRDDLPRRASPRWSSPGPARCSSPSRPHGPKPELGDDPDALDDLADWLTRDNRQFARNMANRIWFHLIGRGMVEPVDDFRDSNPPSNPALLDALTDRVRRRPACGSGRWSALIMKSQTYQLGPEPDATNADDEANFSQASVRLLPAEVLLDAIGQVLEQARAVRRRPAGHPRRRSCPGAGMGGVVPQGLRQARPAADLRVRAVGVDDAGPGVPDDQRRGGPPQARGRRQPDRPAAPGRRRPTPRSSTSCTSPPSAACRRPRERDAFLAHVGPANDRRKAWEDVAWAILNSKEFLLRH